MRRIFSLRFFFACFTKASRKKNVFNTCKREMQKLYYRCIRNTGTYFINIQPQQKRDQEQRKERFTLEWKCCSGELTKARKMYTKFKKLNRLICWRPKMWWYTNAKRERSEREKKTYQKQSTILVGRRQRRAKESKTASHKWNVKTYIQNQSPEMACIWRTDTATKNHLHHFQSTWKYVEFQWYVLIYLIPWSICELSNAKVCAWSAVYVYTNNRKKTTNNNETENVCVSLAASRRIKSFIFT